jgi:hypothetical protein
MISEVVREPRRELVSVWHRQIGRQRSQRLHHGPRPFAALFIHFRGKPTHGLIELSRLRLDLLHDLRSGDGPVAHRLVRCTAGLVADGIKFGGSTRIQFEKYVNLMPGRRSWRRIASTDTKLLRTALEIDKYLERHSRFPYYPRHTEPRLPRLWVSLTNDHPTGGGAEFEQLCWDTGWSAELALCSVRHLHRGHWFYPLHYVSHHARHIACALVDLSSVPCRQVFRVERPEDLEGGTSSCQFDFSNS